ncbi:hypothetical protein BU25DRAFT_225353 [Macroventuria anomochaeta]|uniref:Uncharacterized protein n=1 Tax=Macroventuria anomochaeta TaxID=301207 RepID=A0ACB6SDI4_9PLEO|nr:uncharacterized protein BU25DRAFT_225353 [Macroventuria anomochaeta]KAF2631162.1 hypothetical protein BU25DRAFT_225353 [Macroventuria anomochaeta]
MTFKSLNIRYLMASMLAYCKALDLLWDPRKDILYLCKSDTVEVQRIRSQLNTQEVKELFLGTSFFSRLPTEDQRLCYRTLLDTEPPPIMAITPPAPQIPKPVRQELRVSEKDSDTKAPRSRYRNASGQRSSSSGKSDHQATQIERLQSMDHLQDLRRLPHIEGIQCVNFAKPQSVSAVAATRRARKSMPNLMAAHNTAPVSHVSAQDARKTTNELQQHHEMPHVTHAPSQPSSTSSQQAHTSSQLKYGGGFKPECIRAKNDTQDTNEGFSLGQRTLTNRTDSTRTDSTGTPIQGIQSQKGSLHVVRPQGEEVPCQQYFQGESAPPRGRLHLVGPEGIHGGLEKPQHTIQPQAQHQRHHQYAPPPQTEAAFVFELDATAPSQPAFTAELPANSIVPSPVEQRTSQDHAASNGQAAIRPPNPRTMSAPLGLESLPASLVAGGPGIHVHRQSLSHPETSYEPMLDFSTRQTNAYRYSSYAFPQSTNSDSLHASSEEATASTYKAYRPFVVTDELSRTDSVSSVYGPGHKRNTSNDSTASHDSSKLAKEYQGLLNFEEGYGSD